MTVDWYLADLAVRAAGGLLFITCTCLLLSFAGLRDHIQERRAYGMGVQSTIRRDHDGRQAARVFASLAVGASVMATATLGHMSSALASNPCATSPGRQTEPGTHWYYQTDPVDHRQCWYLERLPTASVTPRNMGSTVTAPISPRSQPTPAGPERTAGKGTDALERRPAHQRHEHRDHGRRDQGQPSGPLPRVLRIAPQTKA